MPDNLDPGHKFYERQVHIAAKQINAYEYEQDYLFIIESEFGAAEANGLTE